MKNKNIVAIIPARGGSKGIPGKNIMDFCGKPLILWSIEQALKSTYVKKVCLTSEDEKILSIAKGSGIQIIKRPQELSGDTTPLEPVLLQAINEIERIGAEKVDYVVLLQPTSPLRARGDIDNAIKLFISQKADSLFSAAILEDFCAWEEKDNEMRSITFDYKNRGRRQDRKNYYLENGSIYVFNPKVLRQENNRLGGKIIIYPMPLWSSYEIDTVEDIGICKYYMENKILKEKAG